MLAARVFRSPADPVIVFVLALAVRAGTVWNSRGGPFGNFGYDSGVYYSAADALIHGRMPYADFTLLHPPALMLFVTPFAFLGTLTSDHFGFVVANTAFEAIGALNAVLVLLVARRAGVGRFAALVGGLFYALWPGAVGSEISIRLEPLGNLLLLFVLLVLVRSTRLGWSTRGLLIAGACLGGAAVTKIWWAVPLVIVVAWTAARDRRQGLLLAAGAAASMVLIAGPFFVRSPATMWRMVVNDQLGRPRTGGSVADRLGKMTALHSVLPSAAGATRVVVLLMIAVIGILACARAWRRVELRLVVALAVAQVVVLLAGPTYFAFYTDYLAPAASLVLAGAVAASTAVSPARRRLPYVAGYVCLLAVTAAAVDEVVVNGPSVVSPFPRHQLARAASQAHLRCIMADSPTALIQLDVLSQGLANGCPNRVDVSGSTYDVDQPVGALGQTGQEPALAARHLPLPDLGRCGDHHPQCDGDQPKHPPKARPPAGDRRRTRPHPAPDALTRRFPVKHPRSDYDGSCS